MATKIQLVMVFAVALEQLVENPALSFGDAVDEAADELVVTLTEDQRYEVMTRIFNTAMSDKVPGAAEA